MPNYLIGKENLPNVYIDSITIDDDSMSIELCMYDFTNETASTWKNNAHMQDLKVLVATTNNQNIINLINISGSSLLDFQTNEFVVYKSITIQDFETDGTIRQFSKFKHKLEFNYGYLSEDTLNVYACTMVDIGLFTNPQLNKYCGAVTGEKIFVNGEVPTESGYFYYPDTNEEYGGPVHLHNEEFMENSMHSSAPHKVVRYVPETNSKITDERGS